MITTLMPHLRIGPYKEGVLIDQIQMPFHAVGCSFPYELLIVSRMVKVLHDRGIYVFSIYILIVRSCFNCIQTSGVNTSC